MPRSPHTEKGRRVYAGARLWTFGLLALAFCFGQTCGLPPAPPDDSGQGGNEDIRAKEYTNVIGYWIPDEGDADSVSRELAEVTLSIGWSAFKKFALDLSSGGPWWALVKGVFGEIPTQGCLGCRHFYVKKAGTDGWSTQVKVCADEEVLLAMTYVPYDYTSGNYEQTASIMRSDAVSSELRRISLMEAGQEMEWEMPTLMVVKEPISFAQCVDESTPSFLNQFFRWGDSGNYASIEVDLTSQECAPTGEDNGGSNGASVVIHI